MARPRIFISSDPQVMEWISTRGPRRTLFRMRCDLFDQDGRLKVVTPEEWNAEALEARILDEKKPDDDDIPF